MNYGEFQERFEQAADAEYQRYLARPVSELVDAVRTGRHGAYHTIWRAIAAKAAVEEAGWAVYAVVASDAQYLTRYHAAGALLSLLQSRRFEAADLAVASPHRDEWITAVREDLVTHLSRS